MPWFFVDLFWQDGRTTNTGEIQALPNTSIQCRTGKSTNSLSKYFTSPPLQETRERSGLAHQFSNVEVIANDSWLIWLSCLRDIWLEWWCHLKTGGNQFTSQLATTESPSLRCWIANQSMPVKKGCPFTWQLVQSVVRSEFFKSALPPLHQRVHPPTSWQDPWNWAEAGPMLKHVLLAFMGGVLPNASKKIERVVPEENPWSICQVLVGHKNHHSESGYITMTEWEFETQATTEKFVTCSIGYIDHWWNRLILDGLQLYS